VEPDSELDSDPRGDLDADLIAYYDAEAATGRRAAVGEYRRDVRDRFARVISAEGRRHIVDVGAGPGRDTAAWQADGVDVVGIDLAEANVRLMAQQGLNAATGSLYHLPFRDGSFDSLWTMSTFVHVPHHRFDEAIGEMVRVVEPGSPLAVGTWGGRTFEGIVPFGDLRPHRFFSLATHDRWREMLARHGEVESFETHDPKHDDGWEYQFAILRSPGVRPRRR
jgi:SAM-dependent methyltransferase